MLNQERYRASRPYIAIPGQRANGEYSDLDRHPDAQRIPSLVILRLDAPLYFFNAKVARTQILTQTAADPVPQAMLRDLRAKQIDLLSAQVRGSVHDRMLKTGLLGHLGEEHLYGSTAAAVATFQARPTPAEVLPEHASSA